MSETLAGVFPGLSNDDHHGHSAIGSTGLKLLAQSPLHYWAQYLDPDRAPREETPSLRLGKLTHSASLEPELIGKTLIVLPEELDRRTTVGKQLWKEIVASGKEPISASEWAKVEGMAKAVRAHPVSRLLFEECQAETEVSIFWVDPDTGVNCKIRPDLMVRPGVHPIFPHGLIADLKTTDDATPEAFGKSVWNWEMHIQAALYPEGFQRAFHTDQPPPFLWLAQEKSAPFCNRYYNCSGGIQSYGRKEVRRLLHLFAHCRDTGNWPGYSTDVMDIQMPVWAEKIIEQAIA